MKKVRFLAISLVVALMLMGAGYAYWTDSVDIVTTVKTGTFDVRFAGEKGVTFVTGTSTSGNPGNEFAWDGYGVNAVASGSVSYPDENTATVTLNNLYPGVEGEIMFAIKNTGSVPAKFASASVVTADADDLYGFINTKGYIRHLDTSAPQEWFQGNATTWDAFYDLEAQFNNNGSIEGDILQTGQFLYVYIPFQIDGSLDNDDNLEGATRTFTIKMNFEQFNHDGTPGA